MPKNKSTQQRGMDLLESLAQRSKSRERKNMPNDKKTLVDLLPPGKVKKAGKTISLRQRFNDYRINGGNLQFTEWAKTQK